jgi:hypothetical protein
MLGFGAIAAPTVVCAMAEVKPAAAAVLIRRPKEFSVTICNGAHTHTISPAPDMSHTHTISDPGYDTIGFDGSKWRRLT